MLADDRTLSRFARDFFRSRRDFRPGRTVVRRPESRPARLRLVSLGRTKPSAAGDEKYCWDCQHDPFHSNKVGSIVGRNESKKYPRDRAQILDQTIARQTEACKTLSHFS